jgi:hypothetical protein
VAVNITGLELWVHPHPEFENPDACNFVLLWRTDNLDDPWAYINMIDVDVPDMTLNYQGSDARASLHKQGWRVVWSASQAGGV